MTIPADIYQSGILIEVEGVDLNAHISPETQEDLNLNRKSENGSRNGVLANDTRSNRPRRTNVLVHDPGGPFKDPANYGTDEDNYASNHLPTTVDLAQSFLEAEPAEERAELHAAVSQSWNTQQSQLTEDEEEFDTGLGPTFSLPGFIAGFLQGVADRLRIEVKKVSIDVSLRIDLPSSSSIASEFSNNSACLTLRLSIGNINIDEVTSSETTQPSSKYPNKESTEGEYTSNATKVERSRRISLKDIRGKLLSDASLFAFLAYTSGPSSPLATNSTTANKQNTGTAQGTSPANFSSSSSELSAPPMVQSSVFQFDPDEHDDFRKPDDHHKLEASISTTDGQRFADAALDDAENEGTKLHNIDYDSMHNSSQFQPFENLQPCHYTDLHQTDEAQPIEDSDTLPTFARYRWRVNDQGSKGLPHVLKAQARHNYDSPKRVQDDDLSTPSSESFTHHPSNAHPWGNSESGFESSLSVQPSLSASLDNSSSDLSKATDGSQISSPREDLTQSRIFSHEEAESMYMSAISHISAQQNQGLPVPGNWPSGNSATNRSLEIFGEMPNSFNSAHDSPFDFPYKSLNSQHDENLTSSLMRSDSPTLKASIQCAYGNEKPPKLMTTSGATGADDQRKSDGEVSQSERSSQGFVSPSYIAKNIVSIESVVVKLQQDDDVIRNSTAEAGCRLNHGGIRAQQQPPGAFSTFGNMKTSNSPVDQTSHMHGRTTPSDNEQYREHSRFLCPLTIVVGEVQFIGDIGLTRLMMMITQQLSTLIRSNTAESPRGDKTSYEDNHIRVQLESLSWKFVDVVRGYIETGSETSNQLAAKVDPPDSEVLLAAIVEDVCISHDQESVQSRTKVLLRRLAFGYASDTIISFDSTLKMRESTRDILAPKDADMELTITESLGSIKIDVTTLPLHVNLNLARLDETFGWFGGLSSVLGLGSSMISTVTMMDAKTKVPLPTRRRRNVHFKAPDKRLSAPAPSKPAVQKTTIRIGGLLAELRGKQSYLQLEGSAIKLVSRAEGIGMQLDKLKFSGPHLEFEAGPPAIITKLDNIRVEYLSFPKEVDLARLLALLSPSKNRDESDDDILLETLFRQRRQGGVVRITIGDIEGNVTKVRNLVQISTLLEEMAKLSTVTKYLPEDDRPGILTLVLVRNLQMEAEINPRVGPAIIASKNIEAAYVTFPSLTLVGVSTLNLVHQGQELIGLALPLDSKLDQQFPTIMVRLVGDEPEPTIKIKLWNVRAEYHVSTVLSIMGLSETGAGEAIIPDMVGSVATTTDWRPSLKPATQTSASSEQSSGSSKPLKFEISIRDSIIGLNPRDAPCKGLVVLMNTKVSGTTSRNDDNDFDGSLEIKKASLMIIDDVLNIQETPQLSSPTEQVEGNSVVQYLATTGYVSVSDISAAKITLQMTSSAKDDEKFVDIEIRDELFVLETCADSTQTLQRIINGLNPPTPVSKELKYRTEVVPVQDMLASFSGDVFPAPREIGESEEIYSLVLDDGDLVDDEVPQNLEFVNSFYNPTPERTADDIAESLLEDDLSSLASPPVTRQRGEKRLLQSFQEQYEIDPGSHSLDFNEDHFGANSAMGGTAHRWNSEQNTYDRSHDIKLRKSPFRLRVRDVHFIWNLFDGYDWQHTRDAISQAVTEIETKAAERLSHKDRRKSLDVDEEDSVIGDFLFNSIYIGIPANRDPKDLTRQINRNLDDRVSEAESYATSTTASRSPNNQAQSHRTKRRILRLKRSNHHKLTFELRGVSVDLVNFPPSSGETQNSIDIRVQDLEIFDHVPTSTWKKFATYMHDAGERESGTSMVHVEILNVKPVPDLAASETILKATVLPLRLHVDQDALDFMTRFFEFKDDSAPSYSSPADVPFLQRVEINSIPVKLDFKPRRVDYAGLRSGHTNEFMNFFILDQADMVLRHVIVYGVSGFDKLGKTLNDIWMPDIKRNQLPGILAGLAPVRSLVNVGGGVRDLVVIPMREYRKDGRLMRGIQKGAISFARTTTTELAKLGAKLAIGTQTVLQGAEDFLAPSGNPQRLDNWEATDLDEDEKEHISLYADQPIGVVQGLRGAYRHLERDLVMARDAIIAMPGEVMESASAGEAARAVLRGAPTVILRPALGVTKAVGQTLLGATNSLDKRERRRMEDVGTFLIAQVLRLALLGTNHFFLPLSFFVSCVLMIFPMIEIQKALRTPSGSLSVLLGFIV